jgi:hypothetical protein
MDTKLSFTYEAKSESFSQAPLKELLKDISCWEEIWTLKNNEVRWAQKFIKYQYFN